MSRMRYLYADSELFPRSYDFLSTFRGFAKCAVRLHGLLRWIDQLEARVTKEGEATRKGIEAIDQFATSVRSAIEQARSAHDEALVVHSIAERLGVFSDSLFFEQHTLMEERLREEEARTRSEIATARDALRDTVVKFLVSHRLEVLQSDFFAELAGTTYIARAVRTHEGSLDATYELAIQEDPAWARPMRIRDLVDELEVQVGMKRNWISRGLNPEIKKFGDYVIGYVRLEGDVADIRVRRKVDAPDSFEFLLERSGDELTGEIRAVDQAGDGFVVAPDDLKKLEQLWRMLEEASKAPMDRPASVSSVRFGGQDLFDSRQIREFIDTFIGIYVPIAVEIGRRSPSRNELSLKIEHNDGRREELYLSKSEISDLLSGLDSNLRERFTLDGDRARKIHSQMREIAKPGQTPEKLPDNVSPIRSVL